MFPFASATFFTGFSRVFFVVVLVITACLFLRMRTGSVKLFRVGCHVFAWPAGTYADDSADKYPFIVLFFLKNTILPDEVSLF